MKIEHTTLNDVVKNIAIYYDPDPMNTIISDDVDLVNLFNEIPNTGYN
jgi:DNA-directed RNA polymerase II subunit RPB1